MARNKAKFDEWLTEIINVLNVSDSISISTDELDKKHWKQIWDIYDEYVEKMKTASSSDRLIIEDETSNLAQGVLLDAAGTNLEDFEIDQEIARIMERDDD